MDKAATCGQYYKNFTIVIYDRNDMASALKLNYNCKALASGINYDRKCDATIWSINLISLFTTVIFSLYKPLLEWFVQGTLKGEVSLYI